MERGSASEFPGFRDLEGCLCDCAGGVGVWGVDGGGVRVFVLGYGCSRSRKLYGENVQEAMGHIDGKSQVENDPRDLVVKWDSFERPLAI